jgi:hypothetical protein
MILLQAYNRIICFSINSNYKNQKLLPTWILT